MSTGYFLSELRKSVGRMNQPEPGIARAPRLAMISWRGRLRTISEACTLAVEEQQRGNTAGALKIYNLVAGKVPASAEIQNNRAAVLLLMERYDEALAGYDRAIWLKPDYTNAHFNRGLVLKKMSRYNEALASYDQAIRLDPANAEAHNNRGVLLQQIRKYEEALASYARAIAAKPNHAAAHNNRGTALMSQGNLTEAESMFRRAFKLDPQFADPLFNLATMRRHANPSGPEFKAIVALLDRPDLPQECREQLLFALGKIYDDCGLYEQAFDSYREGNRLRNTLACYKPAAVSRLTREIIENFGQEILSRRIGASAPCAPVFIVGMPRSGTTLLAHILSNHPAIASAGELPAIIDFLGQPEVAPKARTGWIPHPRAARDITSATAERLLKQYEARLRRDVQADVSHIVDKNPLNFRHVGLITLLFPGALIIHCRRDPLDTGLSNYFQRFPLSLDYSFDLRNIGHFYQEYSRLMDHWRRVAGERILEIRYEDIVLNTRQTVQMIFDSLKLRWDDRCLRPETNPTPVETASGWQVRQPIFAHSLQRWRHYEKQLAPLKEMLAAEQ